MRYANLFFNGEEMPKQDIRTLLTKQIADLTTKVTEARASLIYWQSEVTAKEEELAKLQGALDSLDGKAPASFVKHYDFQPAKNMLPDRVFAAPTQAKPETVHINGEEVVLEPGFHVEKNSFGEDCIVPDGVKYAPAAEPAATPDTNLRLGQAAIPLPAITSGEQFDSPEDIISGELPNG
jgi:hypothetical protein